MRQHTFRNRQEAGRALADSLRDFAGRGDVVVLALPRGGVPVAAEVAAELDAPLDVMVVRKVGVPGHEELAMGAVASGGVLVRNDQVLRNLHIDEETINLSVDRQFEEVRQRELRFRGDRAAPSLEGKTVIVVDDGIATGSTMRAAIRALVQLDPAEVVVAVPVAPPETCEDISRLNVTVRCLATPSPFVAVGAWYDDFRQTTDEEVRSLLDAASTSRSAP